MSLVLDRPSEEEEDLSRYARGVFRGIFEYEISKKIRMKKSTKAKEGEEEKEEGEEEKEKEEEEGHKKTQ